MHGPPGVTRAQVGLGPRKEVQPRHLPSRFPPRKVVSTQRAGVVNARVAQARTEGTGPLSGSGPQWRLGNPSRASSARVDNFDGDSGPHVFLANGRRVEPRPEHVRPISRVHMASGLH